MPSDKCLDQNSIKKQKRPVMDAFAFILYELLPMAVKTV